MYTSRRFRAKVAVTLRRDEHYGSPHRTGLHLPIRNPACPERIPDRINLTLDFTGDHEFGVLEVTDHRMDHGFRSWCMDSGAITQSTE